MQALRSIMTNLWASRKQEITEESVLPVTLAGKIIMVTGATSGIGEEIAKQLAWHGAHVYLASRNESKASEVIETIRAKTPTAMVTYLHYDAASIRAAYETGMKFLQLEHHLDVLINNAGIIEGTFKTTTDGIESMIGVNHFSPFMLTMTLWPALLNAPEARIVNVSSAGHAIWQAPTLDLNHLRTNDDERSFSGMPYYGRSKTCNILFTKELARRAEVMNIRYIYANACHPGTIYTNLNNTIRGDSFIYTVLEKITYGMLGIPPSKGVINPLYCALHPEIREKDLRGRYFVIYGQDTEPYGIAGNMDVAADLWDKSISICNEIVPTWQCPI